MEAYLEVFERTARRESWPEDQWAHILSPFLTGPAQQASQDLAPERASQYPALRQAKLAYYGLSLAARAQRFHEWRFDCRGAVRTQISQHRRLIRRWLADREGPSLLDRVLIDNNIRQLPAEARRTLATNHPNTIDELVRQLENWQVAQQLSQSIRNPSRPTETHWIGEDRIPHPEHPHRDRRPSPRSPERTEGASVADVPDT